MIQEPSLFVVQIHTLYSFLTLLIQKHSSLSCPASWEGQNPKNQIVCLLLRQPQFLVHSRRCIHFLLSSHTGFAKVIDFFNGWRFFITISQGFQIYKNTEKESTHHFFRSFHSYSLFIRFFSRLIFLLVLENFSTFTALFIRYSLYPSFLETSSQLTRSSLHIIIHLIINATYSHNSQRQYRNSE